MKSRGYLQRRAMKEVSFDMENAKFILKGFPPGNVRDAMTNMVAEIERLHVLNVELIEFVKLYDRTYVSTQRNPTASEEVIVIGKARAILAKAQPSTET
jgi:hypothetical protein